MSKEIKFKVWDNWNKKFLDYGEVDIWDLVFAEPKLMEEIYTDGIANECLEFLQFTGLKDKNGVEIYEGDIVKKVEEETEITTGISTATVEDVTNIGFLIDTIIEGVPLEVIGNIYENKELLTNKN